jgi:hypothetical protein
LSRPVFPCGGAAFEKRLSAKGENDCLFSSYHRKNKMQVFTIHFFNGMIKRTMDFALWVKQGRKNFEEAVFS